jgi:hypothetical protein
MRLAASLLPTAARRAGARPPGRRPSPEEDPTPAARRGLFPRGERPALGTRRHPRQDRKALRKPGFPFQEGRLRRFGLSRGNPVSALRDGVSYWALFPGLDGISEHIKQIIKRDLE